MNLKILNNLSEKETREKYFFHDLINHTHGLLLFLTEKDSSHKGLTPEEVAFLCKDLKALQALIKAHKQHEHKNLQSSDKVSFCDFTEQLFNLTGLYLSSSQFELTLEIDADLNDKFFNHATLSRIVHNIIKNISENGKGKTVLKFSLENNQLCIFTSNELKDLLPERNGRVIGVAEAKGIKSIEHLCLQSNGKYHHKIADQQWINNLILPLEEKDAKKSA